MPELKSYAVWDVSTRWFHWINALCVIMLAFVGFMILNAGNLDISNAGKVALKKMHIWIGFVFVLNLTWRIVWAFLGNRYARWQSVFPGGRGYLHALRSYLAAFIAGRPEQYLGHNPAGRLGIAAVFLLITLQAITGLILAGTDLFYPPIGPWIAHWIAAPGIAPESLIPYAPERYDAASYESMRAFRKPFAVAHLYSFYGLVVVVILHVTAVIITELREGGSIISAMFTGRKIISKRPVDEERNGHD
ncbi:putative Cytochrome b [Candidatus Methylobacter favarea]|uniref:Putative Cytochrome b n=1 Tax=Candidatus Methylobacter favarea TaxID=2707345 RepID=A0A8S0XW53_9GAMM|nr:cytochrome b/b6 domain-containing protein [Candidatus Methylobacter favarea]CAA9892998.1 putative Cytochrome b [Candidatus Methylobacter favarea]